ncbi:ThuA domain-containing protein [Sphingobium sp.]|uniref:ThuA domain-containing protein n=1 Tax=Sphingobium sp. TaxID=1912891 RepID=UPI0028BD1A36|nr:ThuA domain-containing protein [Sphingobium sp.]
MKKALFLALLAAGGTALAQVGNPGGAINDRLGNPDYGVCRGTDPRCFHAWPRAQVKQYRVLLYTRTAGPRHANLGTPLGPGLDPALAESNVVQREMLRIAQENGWAIDYTEDPAQMLNLSGYNAVIFISTSREALDDGGKTALRQYMRAGGGFVAVHNAFGTLYNWPYYEGLLGNANFFDHGPARDGDVVVVDGKDASTSTLPRRWRFHDEWYNLVPFPTQVRFLATIDEKSWDPAQDRREGDGPPPSGPSPPNLPPMSRYPSVVGRSPGHGTFHPVAWCQYYDGGKVWATTLGHDAKAFEKNGQPGAAEFQAMLVGAIKSVMGAAPFCT